MSSKHEEIYERYLAGETDFRRLGKDYGVTRERIRQVVDKMDKEAHPLREPISRLCAFRNQLEESAGAIVGKVDADTIGQYNDLVAEFDKFVGRLKQIDEGRVVTENKTPTDGEAPDLYRTINEYKMSKELKTPIANLLMRNGINNLKDLTYATPGQLNAIRRMGDNNFNELKEFAKEKHIELGSNADKMPVFHPGDKVVCMSGRTRVKKGTVLIVKEDSPSYGPGYHHPTYRLVDDTSDGCSYYVLSVGEIKRV